MTILDTLRPHANDRGPRDPWRTRLRGSGRRTFAAFEVPNYRLYFAGQSVSLVGTWMQQVAQAWLVFHVLTDDSAGWLGIVVALQTLPVLIGGPYGGVIADRSNKRRLLLVTQAAKGLLSLVMAAVVLTGAVQLWMVVVFALALGCANVFDNPTRQTFIPEIVGPDLIANAVSLNSVMVNVARAVGPAVGGVLIATVGVGTCFLVDAASYVAVIAAILAMNVALLRTSKPSPRAPGQVREGLRYVRRTPELLVPLLMMTLVGTLSYEFLVTLPAITRGTFGGGAEAYGLVTASMGIGAVVGGLNTARRAAAGVDQLVVASALFGVAILAAACAPWLWLEMVVLLFVGAASIGFLAVAMTTLQLSSAPQMRGRVMALCSVAFLGTTPIGAPIVGWIAENAGARWSLAVGAVAALAAAAMGRAMLRHGARLPSPTDGVDSGLAAEARVVEESEL